MKITGQSKWEEYRRPEHTGFAGFLEYWVLMWKNYGSLKGRAVRAEFWSVWLCNVVISAVLALIPLAGRYLTLAFFLATIAPTIATYVRRAHDLNRTGRYVAVLWVIAGAAAACAGVGFVGFLLGAFSNGLFGDRTFAAGLAAMFISIPLAVIALILFLLLGCRKSYPAENAFGPAPGQGMRYE